MMNENKIINKPSNYFRILYPYVILGILSFWISYKLLKEPWADNLWLGGISNMIFFLFLAFWNQTVLKITLFITAVFSIFIYPTLEIYGFIDQDFLASLIYTNVRESTSYIKMIPKDIIIQLAIFIVLMIVLLFSKFHQPKSKFYRVILMVYLAIIPTLFFFFRDKDKEQYVVQKIWYSHISPVKYGIYLFQTYVDLKKESDLIIAQSKIEDSWQIQNADDILRKDNVVIIIGESLRKDFMHQYGFPLENTPFIDHSPHLKFEQFLSAGTHTVSSLQRMLAFSDDLKRPAIHNSLVKLLKKAGYQTFWASNQGFIGKHDSAISIFSKSCDVSYNLFGGSYNGHKDDLKLIPVFNQILDENHQQKVIFLHPIGSHPDACDITEGKYDQFYISDQISCYSTTIRMMDDFIKQVYHRLKSTGKSFSLIYFSDHGTVVNSELNVVHGDNIRQAYEVPLLVWGDDIHAQKAFKALRNGNDFVYFVSELLKISTKNIRRTYRFISDDVDEKAEVIVNADRTLGNINQLEENKIPFELAK